MKNYEESINKNIENLINVLNDLKCAIEKTTDLQYKLIEKIAEST
jgi:hypothetical protein